MNPFNIFNKSVNILKSLSKSIQENRPEVLEGWGGDEEGVMPILPLNYYECDTIYHVSDTLGIIIDSLTNEIFRNGWEWNPCFIKKCANCGAEYEQELSVCEFCQSTVFKEPSPINPVLKNFFKKGKVNKNNQNFTEVMQEVNTDLETKDMGYVLLNKEYTFINNKLQDAKILEILRLNPNNTRIIANKQAIIGFNDDGEEYKFCPIHRNKAYLKTSNCPICNKLMMRACYVNTEGEQHTYYNDSEVIHTPKYSKGLLYGWPQIVKAYTKILTLIAMDNLIYKWYKEGKPPKGMLLINSANTDGLKKNWQEFLEKAKANPASINPFAIPSKATGKGGRFAEFIQFTNTLDEMQYTATRDELRRTIGALWGVMPVFQADISTSGGLNNEGLQVTVTTRAALNGQKVFDEKIVPWILEQFGITDYVYELVTPEEKDEMAELQREQLKIQNAQSMLNMGFEVELNENKDFEFSGKAQNMMRMNQSITPEGENNDFTGSPSKPINKMVKFNIKEEAEAMHRAIQANKSDKALIFDDDLFKTVNDEFAEIEKMEECNIIMKSEDITNILKETIYDLTFKSINKEKSDKIKNYLINKTDEKISLQTIIKAIQRIGEVSQADAERIARTEYVNVLQNKSREIAYKQRDDGTYKYAWTGPTDNRETSICKNIRNRTSQGVNMEELKKIIKEEADPNIYEPSRPWSPHINCRHRLIRRV